MGSFLSGEEGRSLHGPGGELDADRVVEVSYDCGPGTSPVTTTVRYDYCPLRIRDQRRTEGVKLGH